MTKATGKRQERQEARAAAYGYVRVSTAQQAVDGESLEAQEQRLRGWAQQAGKALSQVYVEGGVSGSVRLEERPEGQRLLVRVKAGDLIVAPKLDRLFRSASDALATMETLKRRGVGLVLLDLGQDSVTSNGVAALVFGILSSVAQFERERIGERIRDVKADLRRRGVYQGGSVPFGYRVDEAGTLQPIAKEQAAVTLMRRLAKEGLSLRAIATRVKEQTALRVSHMTVQRVLRAAG